MREPLIESDVRGHAQRIARCELAKKSLEARIARAKKHPRRVQRHESVGRFLDELQPLLLDEPGDHPHDRPREGVVAHREPEMLEQGPLARGLALQVLGVKVRRHIGIRRRIPCLGVDAVQDARIAVPASEQHPLEAGAKPGVLRFPGVRRAHRGQVVAVDQPGFQETEPPIELPRFEREHVPRQAETGNNLPGKESLVGEVVNGEDAAGVAEPREAGGVHLEQRRREPRLPVVRVDDVPRRFAGVVLGELERRDRKHAEPFGAVVEVPPTGAVVALAVEEPWHVHHDEPPARGE